MEPVSGRISSPVEYAAALAEMLASPKSVDRAMARNLLHDWRIGTARWEEVIRIGGVAHTALELQDAVYRYFMENVRSSREPDYLMDGLNGENIITGHQAAPSQIHKDAALVRVLDLNDLRPVFEWAKPRGTWDGTLFDFPPEGRHGVPIVNWLDRKLLSASESERREFVGVVLDLLSHHRKENTFQPTWATTWASFEPFEEQGPERWLEVLGMPKQPPRWLVLLVYTVRTAGTLLRPTQLDAGWYAYHFPSAPAALLEEGGHTMDLRVSPRATRLMNEYIHCQIDHTVDHVLKVERTRTSSGQELKNQRRSHHELLVQWYGASVVDWMTDPV
jgi:hypothetical protein